MFGEREGRSNIGKALVSSATDGYMDVGGIVL